VRHVTGISGLKWMIGRKRLCEAGTMAPGAEPMGRPSEGEVQCKGSSSGASRPETGARCGEGAEASGVEGYIALCSGQPVETQPACSGPYKGHARAMWKAQGNDKRNVWICRTGWADLGKGEGRPSAVPEVPPFPRHTAAAPHLQSFRDFEHFCECVHDAEALANPSKLEASYADERTGGQIHIQWNTAGTLDGVPLLELGDTYHHVDYVDLDEHCMAHVVPEVSS
ncbi:hypothetical protein CYMTET_5467, partial [Cymbomonas tetramitiformis]